jgi:hypothetical protein
MRRTRMATTRQAMTNTILLNTQQCVRHTVPLLILLVKIQIIHIKIREKNFLKFIPSRESKIIQDSSCIVCIPLICLIMDIHSLANQSNQLSFKLIISNKQT